MKKSENTDEVKALKEALKREQEKNATSKRLLAAGASVDIIAIATGLPHDEVKHLIVEISKE